MILAMILTILGYFLLLTIEAIWDSRRYHSGKKVQKWIGVTLSVLFGIFVMHFHFDGGWEAITAMAIYLVTARILFFDLLFNKMANLSTWYIGTTSWYDRNISNHLSPFTKVSLYFIGVFTYVGVMADIYENEIFGYILAGLIGVASLTGIITTFIGQAKRRKDGN
jgi:hypothetical protein